MSASYSVSETDHEQLPVASGLALQGLKWLAASADDESEEGGADTAGAGSAASAGGAAGEGRQQRSNRDMSQSPS